MARPLRIQFPGAIYHVMSRGNNKQDIFINEDDAVVFLEVVQQAVRQHGATIHAYCLMINHYHLLIETPKGNLSLVMKYINQQYTQYFNFRHKKVGHVFQGRYKSKLVEKDAHLLELCRYVVNNPVRVGLVECAGNYSWSSYRQTSGQEVPQEWLTVSWILGQFDQSVEKALRSYVAFVNDNIW